jgi:hypothetical protein
MKNFFYIRLLTIAFLLTLSQITVAQNFPIQANITVSPPYTNAFSEYLTGQKINLVLSGKGDVRITGYLKGSTGMSLVLPAQFSHYASRGGIHAITVNGVKKVSTVDLQESFNSLNVVDNSSGVPHKDLIGNYKLPEGDYELCVTVYDAANDVQLSDKACAYFTVSNLEAPFLLTPADKDVVQNASAIFQPMQFQWTFPAGGNPARIAYELQIAELRAGQNAYNERQSGVSDQSDRPAFRDRQAVCVAGAGEGQRPESGLVRVSEQGAEPGL